MRDWRRKITVVSVTTLLLSACSVSQRQNEFSRNIQYLLKHKHVPQVFSVVLAICWQPIDHNGQSMLIH